ncbi:MAG: GNAT family N-acetyltransferase [Tannerella sp.]|jgi:predicted acetyltransferase|nr:GNAT family N-acetyltransferase [Tannerella sp.]
MSASKVLNNRKSSYPLSGDKQEIISLWQDIFQDSNEFIDLFFSRVYKPGNALVIKKDDRIISSLQMIPYEIKTTSGIIPAAYICGVCTLPSERRKGIMKTLMAEAVEEMHQRGYLISTLIPAEPWLFDFYKKFGYAHPINHEIDTIHSSDKQLPDTEFETTTSADYTFVECTTGKHFSYFDRKQRERRCALLHNAFDFETIVRDLTYDGGNAWVALKKNIPVGIAFAKPELKDKIIIKEIFCDSAPIKESLIHYILNLYNARTAEVHLPLNTGKNKNRKNQPYGLACILDKQITDLPDLYMTLMLE